MKLPALAIVSSADRVAIKMAGPIGAFRDRHRFDFLAGQARGEGSRRRDELREN